MSNILKMIAMDLDGTLLDEEKNISQKDGRLSGRRLTEAISSHWQQARCIDQL